jgi:hypothetical protein
MVQSCPEASPVKWHQAMPSGTYNLVLRDLRAASISPKLQALSGRFRWLFNSYYNSLGEQIPDKSLRAYFSRPSLDQVLAFRAYVDQTMEELLAGSIDPVAVRSILLGLNHDQQHQELMLDRH